MSLYTHTHTAHVEVHSKARSEAFVDLPLPSLPPPPLPPLLLPPASLSPPSLKGIRAMVAFTVSHSRVKCLCARLYHLRVYTLQLHIEAIYYKGTAQVYKARPLRLLPTVCWSLLDASFKNKFINSSWMQS